MTRHWWSLLAAITASLGVYLLVVDASAGPVVPILAVLVTVVVVRWAVLWLGRVVEHRGRDGRHRHRCPRCDRDRRRQAGSLLATCPRCGWRPGPPVVRWLVHSVPAVQLRRTVSGPGLVVAVVGAALLAGIAGGAVDPAALDPGSAIDAIDVPWPDPSQSGTDPTPAPSPTDVPGTAVPATGTPTGAVDRTAVEASFVERLNAARTERDLEPVSVRPELRAMGTNHSRAMLTAGRLAHTGVGDGAVRDRFDARGLLPACRIELSEFRYLAGAENVAYLSTGGSGPPPASTIAERLFDLWMGSEEHRRAMLTDGLATVGLGVVADADGAIFASLEMCGS